MMSNSYQLTNLFFAGADPFAKDDEDLTPIDLAKRSNMLRVASTMERSVVLRHLSTSSRNS